MMPMYLTSQLFQIQLASLQSLFCLGMPQPYSSNSPFFFEEIHLDAMQFLLLVLRS
jgi:hypothetical protein